MIVIYIIVAVIAVLSIGYGIYNCFRADDLDEREQELDKYSLHLDERANLLTANEQSAFRLHDLYQAEYKKIKEADVYSASYTVTEADVTKYSTDKAVAANAKNRLAMTLAHDIVKAFDPEEDTTEDGRKRFTYKFKIVK